MSEKNTKTEDWPKINSLIAINASTRIASYDREVAIVCPDNEVLGLVIDYEVGFDWHFDAIIVMIENYMYRILRTPPPTDLSYPYFNVRQLNDDGTTKQF